MRLKRLKHRMGRFGHKLREAAPPQEEAQEAEAPAPVYMEVLDLYPPILEEEDLSPDSFGQVVDDACQEIKEACEGFGTNEKRLLTVMGKLDPEMRCMVPTRYKELHGKDLKDVMRSECGKRPFGQALQFLALDPVTAECEMIRKACKGLGTNELLLFTLVCGRNNEEMTLLKRKYFEIYSDDLGKVLDSELGGDLEKLVFNCLQAAEEQYDPEYHSEDKCAADVEELHDKGIGSWGTDEKGLFKLLCAMPPEHMKNVNLAYAEKYGYTLFKALEKELGGHVQDAALFVVGMKLRPYPTVAGLIDKACKGFGTNELLLTTVLIRYYPYMKEIAQAHEEEYKKDLKAHIKSETGGDYERLLVTILEAGLDD